MKPTTKITVLGLLAAVVATAVSTPVLADPGSQQKNKNQWRNLVVAGAVIAGYGLLTHNQTATVLGAAGAAYSANRYEQDRHHQSQDSANRRWYDRSGYGYGRSYGANAPVSYSGSGQYGSGSCDNGSDESSSRRDPGQHQGRTRHQGSEDHDGDRD